MFCKISPRLLSRAQPHRACRSSSASFEICLELRAVLSHGKNKGGTKTYFQEQALTASQALCAYTQASAYAEFAETKKGKLAPGYYADVLVLDRDLLK
jgi:predicted amidohydrolase YtcJ